MDANLYSQPRPLGWWRFILQFVTVVFAYMAMSLPAVAVFGMGPLGLLLSVVGSMVGGLLVAWLWLRADRALGEAWNLSAFRSGGRTMRDACMPAEAGAAVASAVYTSPRFSCAVE